MGRIKKGILGSFSGKVGTVVGASWKGVAYMRSLPQKSKTSCTERQASQRTKFAITMGYLTPMAAVLRIGWKLYARRQSPFNAATSYTLTNAIVGAYPDFEIDPSKVLISRGALAGAERAEGIQNIAMPTDWSGDDLHVYLGFVSDDGREVANSVYFSV